MRRLHLALALLLTALAPAALAGPRPLSDEELDRVSAAANASAAAQVATQVVLPPPRNPREFLRWLRFRVICSLPGQVCVQ